MALDDSPRQRAGRGAGWLRVRHADGPADLARAQALRHRAFVERAGRPPCPGGRDADRWDALSRHVLVEAGDGLACTFRYRLLAPSEAAASYTGAHYDLRTWAGLDGPLLEIGRLCLAERAPDADVLRAAWGEIARIVRAGAVTLLFGCASFPGADPARHRDSLALLRRHAAPEGLAPGIRAPRTAPLPTGPADPARGARGLPPLLRSYLAMGGWVSGHAVVDSGLDTLHVLTAVEVARIPPARARTLLALA